MSSAECPVSYESSVHTHEKEPVTTYNLKLVLARHGEPTKYGVVNASLTAKGRQKVTDRTIEIMEGIDWNNRGKIHLPFYHTGVLRTKQSAFIAQQVAEDFVEDKGLQNKVLFYPSARPPLAEIPTDDPGALGEFRSDALAKVMEHWEEEKKAYYAFISATGRVNRAYGIQTTRSMHGAVISFAEKAQDWTLTLPSGDQGHPVLFLHETTIGAVAKEIGIFTGEEFSQGAAIEYTEPIFINAQSREHLVYKFRERELSTRFRLNYPHYFGSDESYPTLRIA